MSNQQEFSTHENKQQHKKITDLEHALRTNAAVSAKQQDVIADQQETIAKLQNDLAMQIESKRELKADLNVKLQDQLLRINRLVEKLEDAKEHDTLRNVDLQKYSAVISNYNNVLTYQLSLFGLNPHNIRDMAMKTKDFNPLTYLSDKYQEHEIREIMFLYSLWSINHLEIL